MLRNTHCQACRFVARCIRTLNASSSGGSTSPSISSCAAATARPSPCKPSKHSSAAVHAQATEVEELVSAPCTKAEFPDLGLIRTDNIICRKRAWTSVPAVGPCATASWTASDSGAYKNKTLDPSLGFSTVAGAPGSQTLRRARAPRPAGRPAPAARRRARRAPSRTPGGTRPRAPARSRRAQMQTRPRAACGSPPPGPARLEHAREGLEARLRFRVRFWRQYAATALTVHMETTTDGYGVPMAQACMHTGFCLHGTGTNLMPCAPGLLAGSAARAASFFPLRPLRRLAAGASASASSAACASPPAGMRPGFDTGFVAATS